MATPGNLRRLGALDLDQAAEIHREAFAPAGERGWSREEMAELLASPGVAGLMLEFDAAAGIAICRVAADEAELLTIAVHPAHRRRGAGRRLLDAVLAHVREAGAGCLFLEVAVDNPAARGLYDSAGFRPAGNRPAYFSRSGRPPADGLVMRIDLA